MLRLAKNKKYRKYVVFLISLSIVGNLAHLKVLCFGADGHVEIESAFHEICENPDHCSASNQNILSSKEDHEICPHCGPCVDMPISNDLADISNTQKKLSIQYQVPITYVLFDSYKINSFLYNPTSNGFDDTSYFDPLYTVVLLI